MAIARECDMCGTSYSRAASRIGQFCSSRCANSSRRKENPSAPYRMLYRPGHPLASRSPYIPEHRVILWESIGPGPHPCYRCRKSVNWMPGSRNAPGALVTEHLDRDSRNNAPENLAPSCQRCNVLNRACTVGDDEPHVVRKNGTRLRV